MGNKLLENIYAVEGSVNAAISFHKELKYNLSYTALGGLVDKFELLKSSINANQSQFEEQLVCLQDQFKTQEIQCLSLSIQNSNYASEIKALREEVECLRKSAEVNKQHLKDYHELKKLDPQTLKIQVTKLDGQLTKLKERSNTRYNKLQTQFSDKCTESKKLADRIEQLTTRKSEQPINGHTGALQYFPIVIESPLEFQYVDDSCKLGSLALDWHIEIMSSEGVSVHCGLTEWLTAIIPFSAELQKDWTHDVQDFIHNVALDRLAASHPNNVEMVKQAKAVPLSEVPEFTEREQKLFDDLGVQSLFDLVSLNFTNFYRRASQFGFSEDDAANCYDTINRYGLVYRKLYKNL